MEKELITWRSALLREDENNVREIVGSSGFFRDDEIEVAVELVAETLIKGKESGYEFIFAEMEGKTVAYSCYGLIPCSLISYDLYWIATHQDFRNRGTGRLLLTETENRIKNLGGKAIYVETSSKPIYLPTQTFYYKADYQLIARFENFYDSGDDKMTFRKLLLAGK